MYHFCEVATGHNDSSQYWVPWPGDFATVMSGEANYGLIESGLPSCRAYGPPGCQYADLNALWLSIHSLQPRPTAVVYVAFVYKRLVTDEVLYRQWFRSLKFLFFTREPVGFGPAFQPLDQSLHRLLT